MKSRALYVWCSGESPEEMFKHLRDIRHTLDNVAELDYHAPELVFGKATGYSPITLDCFGVIAVGNALRELEGLGLNGKSWKMGDVLIDLQRPEMGGRMGIYRTVYLTNSPDKLVLSDKERIETEVGGEIISLVYDISEPELDAMKSRAERIKSLPQP